MVWLIRAGLTGRGTGTTRAEGPRGQPPVLAAGAGRRRWPPPAALARALQDRAINFRLVHHEREHRAVAPAAEEEVAVDVHAGVGEGTGDSGHAARPIVHFGQDRIALDVGVAALVEDLFRGRVI